MRFYKIILLYCLCPGAVFSQSISQEKKNSPEKKEILTAMKKATTFMVEKVSYNGGYVWAYLPDFSRRWGEMEAYKTMIWIQPPGTPTMGHVFLDAYHATHDEYYYKAALQVAKALIQGQLPCGGWNYMVDFAGEESIKKWYATIGANGWRLEEFQHYYGNATFDDGGTMEAATFLLRMFLEKKDQEIKTALDKVTHFVIESQYSNGGWPQRYPPAGQFNKHDLPDYSSFITFNDDVAAKNICFMILRYHTLNDTSLLTPIRKAMDVFITLQMPKPQPGWALQYSSDLKPAGARTYEPLALSTSTTEENLHLLMLFYRLTGNKKFLERIPEAVEWLESLRLPTDMVKNNRPYPMFVEIGTNKPMFLHRHGSNVTNGEYYTDSNPDNTIIHYGSTRFINIEALRKEYNDLTSWSAQKATEGSVLKAGNYYLPPFIDEIISQYNFQNSASYKPSFEVVKKVISDLNKDGYWLTVLRSFSNPYIGPAPKEVAPGDFAGQNVGDKYDTSPYNNLDTGIQGISTGVYIRNMKILIDYLTADSVKNISSM
jgi:PelA/Pel-15E family pectate lyase